MPASTRSTSPDRSASLPLGLTSPTGCAATWPERHGHPHSEYLLRTFVGLCLACYWATMEGVSLVLPSSYHPQCTQPALRIGIHSIHGYIIRTALMKILPHFAAGRHSARVSLLVLLRGAASGAGGGRGAGGLPLLPGAPKCHTNKTTA